MKLKTALVIAAFGSLGLANAAVYNINNVDTGTTETLYANKNNVLSTGGIVTIGVFPAGFNLASSLNDANALITNWTTLASGLTGGPSGSLGGNPAGIAEYDPFDMANITGTDPLLGRLLYSFVGNAATLATSTEYALVQIGLIVDDVPAEQSYSERPCANHWNYRFKEW